MTAIYFHTEAYSIQTSRLMGRHAAGHGFLRAWLKYCSQARYEVLVADRSQAEAFRATVKALGAEKSSDLFDWYAADALQQAGALFFPGPGIGDYAWYRRAMRFKSDRVFESSRGFSLVGITHTTASAGALDQVCQLLSAPVEPWDAVICSSEAVKQTVRIVLEQQADYLAQRMGAQRFTLPQLPVIPLGVHPEDFEFTNDQRREARQGLIASVDPSARKHWTIVLFTGRLSFHAKAHPLAMYQALESAYLRVKESSTPPTLDHAIMLVECGWHANEFIEKAFNEAASWAMPHVAVVQLDGRDPAMRERAWASADVFCSLSDNIQETFGITPIEAMAASLPVVVSDWNGYKDTVRDGVDGFRIKTLIPQSGAGSDLALRHAVGLDSYDMYCGYSSQSVALDVQSAAEAICRLALDSSLRQQMGKAGRARVLQHFSWETIIEQYEDLFKSLRLERAHYPRLPKSSASSVPTHPWPARLDPFCSFSHYASLHLREDTLLITEHSPRTCIEALRQCQALQMVSFAKAGLPSQAVIEALFSTIAHSKDGICVNDLIDRTAVLAQDLPDASWQRAIVWLIKMNLVRFPTSPRD